MTFIRCIKSIRTFKPSRGRLFNWLKAISKNEAHTLFQQEQKKLVTIDGIFEEIDNKKDAAEELEVEELVLDAQLLARDLDIKMLETVSRVLIGSAADKLSTAELKRDILVFSRNYPEEFIDVLNDPALQMYDDVVQFFGVGYLIMKNQNRDVYFNLIKNKSKMLTVPYGEDPTDIVASYFQTDDGVETYKLLSNTMKKKK
jgi:hypothetical protein